MKLLAFDIWGDYGYFRRGYTSTSTITGIHLAVNALPIKIGDPSQSIAYTTTPSNANPNFFTFDIALSIPFAKPLNSLFCNFIVLPLKAFFILPYY